MITSEIFKSVFPVNKSPKTWVKLLNEQLPLYKIDTELRVASFLAQCGHESGGFTKVSENLNYSRAGLLRVFPKYFNESNVDAYAGKPEKIANRVYANRIGNGNEASGDGFRYKGRGVIQLTGKHNYYMFAQSINDMSIVEKPELLETNKYALLSALWFWSNNSLNNIADTGDFRRLTKRINGGYIGIEHRLELFNKLMKKL